MSIPASPSENSLVLSYLELRRAIGLIGVALPFVLVVGKILLESPGLQPSISDYYYTVMRDVFVGSLCAIGIFLASYRGYERRDAIAGNLGSVFAIGIALFPTTPAVEPNTAQQLLGHIHIVCAGAFFSTLAYFSLVLFRQTNPNKAMTLRKKQRNWVYVACGAMIVASIALITIYSMFLSQSSLAQYEPVFWLESVAILAFGISWLTKGEALLGDPP